MQCGVHLLPGNSSLLKSLSMKVTVDGWSGSDLVNFTWRTDLAAAAAGAARRPRTVGPGLCGQAAGRRCGRRESVASGALEFEASSGEASSSFPFGADPVIHRTVGQNGSGRALRRLFSRFCAWASCRLVQRSRFRAKLREFERCKRVSGCKSPCAMEIQLSCILFEIVLRNFGQTNV